MKKLREKQIKEFVPYGRTNLKFSFGGLVDIEYFVQFMQIIYGKEEKKIRTESTLKGIESLFKYKIINEETYLILQEAYKILRLSINCLRIVRGNTKDLLLPNYNCLEARYFIRRFVSFSNNYRNTQVYEIILKNMEKVIKVTKESS